MTTPQRKPRLLPRADDVVIVSKGQIVWSGSATEIRADEDAQHRWLGV